MELLKFDSAYKEKTLPRSLAWSLGLHLILFYSIASIVSTQIQPNKNETLIKIRAILIEEKTRPTDSFPQQNEPRPLAQNAELKPAPLSPDNSKSRAIQSSPKPKINQYEMFSSVQRLPVKTQARVQTNPPKTPQAVSKKMEIFEPSNSLNILPVTQKSIETKLPGSQSVSISPIQPSEQFAGSVSQKMQASLISRDLKPGSPVAEPIGARHSIHSNKMIERQAAQKQIISNPVQTLPIKNQTQAKTIKSKAGTAPVTPSGVAKNMEKTFFLQSSAKPFILSTTDLEEGHTEPGESNQNIEALNSAGSTKDSQASLKLNREGTDQGPRISGDEFNAIRSGFVKRIRDKIEQVKKFPRRAKVSGWEGTPVVLFTLGKEGRLNHLALAKASEFPTLDEAALATIKEASPFPKIPKSLNVETMKFKLPISFVLE